MTLWTAALRGKRIRRNPWFLDYTVVKDDFTRAGEASGDEEKAPHGRYQILPPSVKVSICMYEGEINMVIHADGGGIRVEIYGDRVRMILKDKGPGIKDVDKAMQAGWSTASEEHGILVSAPAWVCLT